MAQADTRSTRRAFLSAIPVVAAAVALPAVAVAKSNSPALSAMLSELAEFAEAAPDGFLACIDLAAGVNWYVSRRVAARDRDLLVFTKADAVRLRELARA